MSETNPSWDKLFESLVVTPFQVALVVTGGGTGAVERCFRRPGASGNFVEAVIPYSRAASQEYLGQPPAGPYASEEFARQLAELAFHRASRLSDREQSVPVGISLAAALPTNRADTTEQRIHVALHTVNQQRCWSESWSKGSHTRVSAEALADQMVYRAINALINQ